MSENKLQIGLLVTCLVDFFRPQIGFATIKLLKQAGCEVHVPSQQTCCGQPAYNNGDRQNSVDIAKQVISSFETFDYVVLPSGSCAGMLKKHYPDLLSHDKPWHEKAINFSKKVFEITSFLVDVLGIKNFNVSLNKQVTYHDACAGLRELNIKQQPRELLGNVEQLTLTELEDCDVCCGFGGTFCVKYPAISNKMVTDKTQQITATQAEMVLAGDLGCLMNIAGKLQRQGSNIQVRHIAEVLAEMTETPAIGEPL